MICVAISSKNTSLAIEKSKEAIQQGAHYIEIRIDHFSNPFEVDPLKLVKSIASKLILTIRKPSEGGQFSFEESQRLELIRKCIKAKPFAIDLESSITSEQLNPLIQEAHKNQVKIILSFHDFQKTPEIAEMKELIMNAINHRADFVKIIGMANTIQDNLKMLALPQIARELNINIISFAMGRKGLISRILSPIFGATFTFAALDKATAPGQISIQELKRYLEKFRSYSGVD
ncbi:MAG: type I 3-dehydroquinate dehydratase [Candidatus Helarchaeota archaeon]